MNSKNTFLLLTILIPILMIVIVAISLLVFHSKEYPQNNFLYATIKNKNYYECSQQLKAALFPNTPKTTLPSNVKAVQCEPPNLYVYDFNKREASKIMLEEARKLTLSEGRDDDEGLRVSTYCSLGSGMGWWWNYSSYNDVCLTKKGYQERLNISPPDDSYFIFIGWILNQKS